MGSELGPSSQLTPSGEVTPSKRCFSSAITLPHCELSNVRALGGSTRLLRSGGGLRNSRQLTTTAAIAIALLTVCAPFGHAFGPGASNTGVRGGLVWSFRTGGNVDSSPTVVNGVVYVGSEDGRVYALNASTGAKVWSY